MPISKKTASVILRALSSGVVPSRGAEQIAVGRREEVSTFEEDLENAAEGSGTFRFIIGSYGSGKTFMTQLIRARALDKGFAVMNADLTPANRMRGSGNEGVATYRLLMSSLSVRGMADGGALESVIQGWFQSVRDECAKDPIYQEHPVRAAESGIRALTSGISQSGLLHDFQSMLVRYYVRSTGGHDASEIVKWFDGSCCSLKEARELGAENCVREDNWFLFLKIWADFFRIAGYKGLAVIIDQADVLVKLGNAARNSNYEMILSMYNDITQNGRRHMAVYMCGTDEFLKDPVRGMFSYGALKTRLEEGRFAGGNSGFFSPVVKVKPITPEEQVALLLKIRDIHQIAYGYESPVTQKDAEDYVVSVRSNSEEVSPRMLSRDFIDLLNHMYSSPGSDFGKLIEGRSVEKDTGAVFRD